MLIRYNYCVKLCPEISVYKDQWSGNKEEREREEPGREGGREKEGGRERHIANSFIHFQ